MYSKMIFCLFGCVILTSLWLLDNCVAAFASADSDVNEINSTETTNSSDTASQTLPPPSSAKTKVFIDGEYNVNVEFNKKIRHAEVGEYEIRNGRQVFVVRGIFEYYENDVHIVRPYVFDSRGYHEIDNGIDIRVEGLGDDCDLSTGQYCIDTKLLRLLVG